MNKLGNSSVSYEVGVFEDGGEQVSAVGGYTHVFVESESRISVKMGKEMRNWGKCRLRRRTPCLKYLLWHVYNFSFLK